MPFLIDGYNLLYALGRLTSRSGRDALQGARRWLLLQLRLHHGPTADVSVIFDAQSAPPGTSRYDNQGGIHVEFAREESADDRIEDLIDREASPKLLTVISDDHRIQQAARRRGCNVLGCLDYHERHLQPRPTRAASPAGSVEGPGKPDAPPTAEEMAQWLEAFGEIEDDPRLRDPY